jgi:hypothetical protein
MIATAMAKKEANKEATTPTPNTIKKDVVPKVVDIDDIITPKEKEKVNKVLINKNIPPAEGRLIQVEGLVLKEVTELTIMLNIPNFQLDQIFAMNEYVKNNWHYVFDPKLDHDTWRSAEATISLKYNGKYPGDCDDFAILMASFARQIGLESRMIGAYDNNGSGHAFAEFLVPKKLLSSPLLYGKDYRSDYRGKWMSLDWFKGGEHKKYINDIHVFEEI